MSNNHQNEGGPSENPEYPPAAGAQQNASNEDEWLTVEQIGDVEEYFPRIRQRVADPNNNTPFTIKCPVCLETVFDSEKPGETRRDGYGPVLTPCGHVLCRPCLRAHLDHQESSDAPRTCPVCRHGFECVSCGAEATLMPLELWEPKEAWVDATYTQTIPEGASQRPQCAHCLEHERWLQRVRHRATLEGGPTDVTQKRAWILARMKKFAHAALVEAAKLCDTFNVNTTRMEDLCQVVVSDALTSLKEAQDHLAVNRHLQDQVVARNEWMGVDNPRRR